MIKKNIKQSIAGLFLILIIMSCGKENDNEQFSPCASGVDSLGFELLWNKKFIEKPGHDAHYPDILAPIILEEDIIVYQRPSDEFHKVRLIKERISTGKILQEVETDVLLNTNSLIVKDVILYLEFPSSEGAKLHMFDLSNFDNQVIMSFDDKYRIQIKDIQQITSNGQIILNIPNNGFENPDYFELTSFDMNTKDVIVLFNSKTFLDTMKCNSITHHQIYDGDEGLKLVFVEDCILDFSNKGLYIIDVTTQTIDYKILLRNAEFLYTKVIDGQLLVYYKYHYIDTIALEIIQGRKLASYNLKDGTVNWERKVSNSYHGNFDIKCEKENLLLFTGSWDLAVVDINTGTELNKVSNIGNEHGETNNFRYSQYYKDQLFYISNNHSNNIVSLDLETNCFTRFKSIKYDSTVQLFNDFSIDKDTDILYINTEIGLSAFKINY